MHHKFSDNVLIKQFDETIIKTYSLKDIILFLDDYPEIIDINLFRHRDYLENQKIR